MRDLKAAPITSHGTENYMDLLILGGTVFLGRSLVQSALSRGHSVTLFNRGIHNPDLFPQVEKLRGDRTRDLAALSERKWDRVVDTCAYTPRAARLAAQKLRDRCGHYTLISSISVYADFSAPGLRENSPVGTLQDETVEEVTGETYGPLKALCELVVMECFPDRSLIVRPGLIVGPHDETDRFTYWPARLARGGEVLCPAPREAPVQIIDVRDLADWTLNLVERGDVGTYNATGPERVLTMEALLEQCAESTGGSARLTWVDESFLLEQGVQPWTELPLWVPRDGSYAGICRTDCSKAIAAGLRFRPLSETVLDTLAWCRSRPADYDLKAGLSAEKEHHLLQAWRQGGAGTPA
ncbi:MAG TPA: SDR family oxidoreductase [Chthonomonadales bacterium]|nr:SDR family oxidoreductase [Chthonomonadales bacterium]